MRVSNEARQDVEIPVGLLWQCEEKVGCLTPWTELGDAAVIGLKEVAHIAKGMTQCLVRLAGILQVREQVIDEFERGEFPLDLQHAA